MRSFCTREERVPSDTSKRSCATGQRSEQDEKAEVEEEQEHMLWSRGHASAHSSDTAAMGAPALGTKLMKMTSYPLIATFACAWNASTAACNGVTGAFIALPTRFDR